MNSNSNSNSNITLPLTNLSTIGLITNLSEKDYRELTSTIHDSDMLDLILAIRIAYRLGKIDQITNTPLGDKDNDY